MNTLRKFLVMSVVMAFCNLCFACSDAVRGGTTSRVTKVERNVSYFSKLELYGAVNVVFVQGKKASARIEGPSKYIKNVVIEQNGETLRISQKGSMSFGHDRNIIVYVASPDLVAVKMKGSGDFNVQGNLDTDNLNVELVGSGDVKLGSVVCDEATMRLVGSGDMDVKSIKTRTMNIALQGSGDFDANLVEVNHTNVNLQGSGDIDLNFNQCGVADCVLRGSGDIELKGSLHSLNQQKSGSGDIDTSELICSNN